MATSNADIVAELSTKAECAAFAAFLTNDRNRAVFLQGSATQSLTNFDPAAERQTAIGALGTDLATDRAALPGISDERRRLRAERDIIEKESALLTLRTEAFTQGGDDRAQKQYERNSYEDRIARADALLPLVAARADELTA